MDYVLNCVGLAECHDLIFRFLGGHYPDAEIDIYTVTTQTRELEWAVGTVDKTGHPAFPMAACWAVRTRKAYGSWERGPSLGCWHAASDGNAARICAPLFSVSEHYGMISLTFAGALDDSSTRTTELDIKLAEMRSIAQRFSVAVATVALRTTLEEAALTDRLTQLPNRRCLEQQIAAAVASAKRLRSELGFLLLDIDHFKKFNDDFGHDVGDEVLRQTAQRLRSVLRSSDAISRIGGEEFRVLCEGVSADALVNKAKQLRETIEQGCIVQGRAVTVSIGSVHCTQLDAFQWPELYRSADVALRRAKQSSRKRVCSYERSEDAAGGRPSANPSVQLK